MDYSNCQQRAVTAAAEMASHQRPQPLAPPHLTLLGPAPKSLRAPKMRGNLEDGPHPDRGTSWCPFLYFPCHLEQITDLAMLQFLKQGDDFSELPI